MKTPIQVHSEIFDIEKLQPDIDQARSALADYLDHVPRRSKKSKHGLMGPVGKILSEIKSGRKDPGSLKGYAIRAQESLGDMFRMSISATDIESLDKGIEAVVKLIDKSPTAFHDKIIDRLDYGLYFELRRRDALSKRAREDAWVNFLRTKYISADALAAAWAEPGVTFEKLHLPKKIEGSLSKTATAKQSDVAEFWKSQGFSLLPADEEDE